jgi:magnesium chelatase subunit D
MSSLARFPFSAVVGQSEARLALLLAAVDPGIGGVLLRGDKGSAKSTLARGLAGMLPGGAPFVELPLGATEDRVLGTLDVQAGGPAGEAPFRPGLLARANGGVLYVDEVNLLPDHLVDMLLDVAESGLNRVERDGLSHTHPARFVLVGSMNPEEGELRPQLLDRFGLSVEIKAPTDPLERSEVVRRRLTHDAGGRVGGAEGDIVLRARLAAAMPADLPDTVVDFACRLAVSVGAEGLRADLVLCRAAAAFAGWEGRSVARSSDVERVAPLALGHRRRRRPFDPPVLSTPDLERALAAARQSFADAYPQPEPAAPPSPPPTAADAAAAFDAAMPGGFGGAAGGPATDPGEGDAALVGEAAIDPGYGDAAPVG